MKQTKLVNTTQVPEDAEVVQEVVEVVDTMKPSKRYNTRSQNLQITRDLLSGRRNLIHTLSGSTVYLMYSCINLSN